MSQEDYEDYDSAEEDGEGEAVEEDDEDAQDTHNDAEETADDADEPATSAGASKADANSASASTAEPSSPLAPDPDNGSALSSLVKDLKVTSLGNDKLDSSLIDVADDMNSRDTSGEKAEQGGVEGKPRKWLGVW